MITDKIEELRTQYGDNPTEFYWQLYDLFYSLDKTKDPQRWLVDDEIEKVCQVLNEK